MRYFRPAAFRVLVFLLLCGASFAGTVQLTFVNVGGTSVGGEYVYPYFFQVNGNKTPLMALICDSYTNNISFGQGWTANVNGIMSGNNLFSPALKDYQAAAIIYSEVLAHQVNPNVGVSAADGNLAIWALFPPTAAMGNSGWNSTVQGIEMSALASTKNYNSAFYSGFHVYTPVGASPGVGPQEFIGTVPEPMSSAILGPGLATTFLLLRRRKSQLHHNT